MKFVLKSLAAFTTNSVKIAPTYILLHGGE
jgi:hypothetical protein